MVARKLIVLFLISANTAFSKSKETKPLSDIHQLQNNKILEFELSTQSHYGLDWLSNFIGESSDQVVESGGCKDVNLCCQGKDNKCATRGKKINRQDDGVCYCDSSCLDLEDCCLDYINHCPASDCLLSIWGEWSDCNARCGLGVRQRSREISQQPKNGGKLCEATAQKQVCDGSHCKITRASDEGKEMREAGRIIHSEFSRWRNDKLYDPYKDIRRHIFLKSRAVTPRTTYCALYNIKFVHPSCKITPLLNHSEILRKGDAICVECQPTAVQNYSGGRCFGHGVLKRETRWSFFGKIGCHGTWIMESRKEDCLCQVKYPSVPSYGFV